MKSAKEGAVAVQWREFAKQMVLVGCAVLFYFAVRGVTEGAEQVAIDNGRRVLDLERRLGLDVEREIQSVTTESAPVTTLANWVYIWLHWPVIAATLIWLHHHRIGEYLLLRNAMFISGAIGLIIFVSLPVAPPRLLDAGFVDTVTEYSHSYRVLQPPALVNKFAAMPSLHVGWNLLIGVSLFRATTSLPVRLFAVVGPLLMAIAVVVTANHYILDGVVGLGVALIGLWGSHRLTHRIVNINRRLSAAWSPSPDREPVNSDQ